MPAITELLSNDMQISFLQDKYVLHNFTLRDLFTRPSGSPSRKIHWFLLQQSPSMYLT